LGSVVVSTHQVGPEEAARLHELLMDVVRVAGLLQDRSVGGHTVSMSQVFALHELDTDTPLSQRDLADRLQLEKSSVSRMVAEMERKGLLRRERDPDNHRQYRIRLTDHGRATHARMASTFHQHYERLVASMTSGERAALLKGLPALVRAIRQQVR
jgi:DNA-binding MarR family transcriptional regulator